WQRKRADCKASTYPERPGRVRSRATVRSGWEQGLVPAVLTRYAKSYETEFRRRLKVAGLLRTAAFSPHTASLVASVLTHAPGLTSFVLRATRSGGGSLKALE